MPRGKITNWRRMFRGDSFGMSDMNAERRMKNEEIRAAPFLNSSFCILRSSSRPRHNEIGQVSLQLRGRIRHDDSVLVADGFAQPAGDAFVLLDECDLVVIGNRLILGIDHVDALERADVDAKLASRAQLLDHFGLRDFPRLDARDELTVLVLDGVDRAVNAAHRAVDAALGMDVVLAARRPPDGIGGALDLADGAADAL